MVNHFLARFFIFTLYDQIRNFSHQLKKKKIIWNQSLLLNPCILLRKAYSGTVNYNIVILNVNIVKDKILFLFFFLFKQSHGWINPN